MRIGLWDVYGGSMPSGWTRWLLEQFEFPFEVVFPKTLDAGNLASKFDVLIFVDGAIPARDARQAAVSRQPATHSGRVPRLARQRQRCADRARTEEVRRGRRHDSDDRLIDRARDITSGCRFETR